VNDASSWDKLGGLQPDDHASAEVVAAQQSHPRLPDQADAVSLPLSTRMKNSAAIHCPCFGALVVSARRNRFKVQPRRYTRLTDCVVD